MSRAGSRSWDIALCVGALLGGAQIHCAYNLIPVESAPWSIEHEVTDMLAALALCGPATTLTFVDGAVASVRDALLRTTHDTVHHVWDVGRSVTAG